MYDQRTKSFDENDNIIIPVVHRVEENYDTSYGFFALKVLIQDLPLNVSRRGHERHSYQKMRKNINLVEAAKSTKDEFIESTKSDRFFQYVMSG